MTNIIKKLTSGWHVMRIVRLGVGILAAVEAIRSHDYAIGILSAFFLYQAITDTGCCGAVGCAVPPPQNGNKSCETSFKEIK